MWLTMYKVVAQSVLLYGREIWMVMGEILKVLEGFRHRAAQLIMGMTEKCGAGGEWGYPPLVETMEVVRLHPIGVYIRIRQATIS